MRATYQDLFLGVILLIVVDQNLFFKDRPDEIVPNNHWSKPDTLKFTPNARQGWGSYNSYLNYSGDSIKFELILYRINSDSLNWEQEMSVGTVAEAYIPEIERHIFFTRFRRNWQLRITPSGDCRLRLFSGKVPFPSRIVIPIQIKYKK